MEPGEARRRCKPPRIYPKVLLTRSTSWSTLYRYRTYYASGYVYPSHRTGNKVVIRAYKRASNGVYYYKKSFTASYPASSSTRSLYKAAVRFGQYDRGTWMLLARHSADSYNALTDGSADYITVR